MHEVKTFAEKDPSEDRRLGVTWTDLTAKGIGAGAAVAQNALSQFDIP